MLTIWCAISGHGYGHAAQVVPVLNELGRLVPNLRAILRTTVPASFFNTRLIVPWDLQPVQQDIGCIQQGPLKIDIPATWDAHVRFHDEWGQRFDQEVSAMQAAQPQVVVADTPYLACAAGKAAGIPTVALVSLTWDRILEPFASPGNAEQHRIISSIRTAYGQADLALRMTPNAAMPTFKNLRDIGPIGEPALSRRAELRKHLGVDKSESLVLIGFGGIPLSSLPWEQMEQMSGYRFIVDRVTANSSARIVGLSSIPFEFKTILASVDAIMTKPGYGTIVEAVALGIPLLYVRRYNFADEAPLVDYLRHHGCGVELALDDFVQGRWEFPLKRALTMPMPPPPPPATGAAEAAEAIAQYCGM